LFEHQTQPKITTESSPQQIMKSLKAF
jgi:hypothetical protein